MKEVAICPGSYDPVTSGHKDIFIRASKLYDKVIVAVAKNPRKTPFFPVDVRVMLLKKVIEPYSNIDVCHFDELLVDLAKKEKASVIVKGLRASSDFEYEFQMAQVNHKLAPEIETVFLVTKTDYAFLSSSAVKEVLKFNGCIENLIPPEINNDLIRYYNQYRKNRD